MTPFKTSVGENRPHSQVRMVGDGESLRVVEARSNEAAGKQWARTVAHRCSGKFVHFGSIDRTPGRCVARTRRAAERNPEPETSDGWWKNPPRDGDPSRGG